MQQQLVQFNPSIWIINKATGVATAPTRCYKEIVKTKPNVRYAIREFTRQVKYKRLSLHM